MEGNPAGLRRHEDVQRDGAVLLAALDDVACLHEHLLVGDVLDGQLIDVLCLVDDDLLVLERFVESEDLLVLDLIFAVQEEDRQVLVGERSGKAVVRDGRCSGLRRAKAKGQAGGDRSPRAAARCKRAIGDMTSS